MAEYISSNKNKITQRNQKYRDPKLAQFGNWFSSLFYSVECLQLCRVQVFQNYNKVFVVISYRLTLYIITIKANADLPTTHFENLRQVLYA